jgi:hypothetical protein
MSVAPRRILGVVYDGISRLDRSISPRWRGLRALHDAGFRQRGAMGFKVLAGAVCDRYAFHILFTKVSDPR